MSEDAQIVTGLLVVAGVPPGVANARGDAEAEHALLVELAAAAVEAPEEEQGGTRVVVAGRFVNLGEASWKLLTAVAALAVSSLDPIGITKAVALKQVLDFVKELRPLLHALDPAKALVCAAVSTVTAEHRRGGGTHGATRGDLERYFATHGEDVPVELDAVLAALERDGVLATAFHPHAGKHYTIRF